MPDNTTSTTGQVRYRRTSTSDSGITEAVYRHSPVGTNEIANAIGLSRQAADYRLKKLEADGPLWSKKVGPTRVWMHAGDSAEGLCPIEISMTVHARG